MSDCYIKKNLAFDLSTLKSEIDAKKSTLEWQKNRVSGLEHSEINDGRYHNGGHKTQWCYLSLSELMIKKIQQSIGCEVYKEIFYLWDYGQQKHLPLHIDSAEINSGKVLACCIPIIGNFELIFYKSINKDKKIDSCVYGPGDLIILNNRRYYHEGNVLSDTRLSLHFFLDFESFDDQKTLIEIIEENRIKSFK